MSNIIIRPSLLRGTVSVPPSKSAAHRAIICAALSDGRSVIRPVSMSEDMTATIGCMKDLGAKITRDGDTLTVDGLFRSGCTREEKPVLDCGESGSTLRFLIPVAAALGVPARFVGRGRLPKRPIGVLTDCLPLHGTECITQGGLPLDIAGQLESDVFEIPGNVSSQFITGLLLSLPLLKGGGRIRLTSPAQSVGYIAMTIKTMKDFGVEVEETPDGWLVPGGQRYISRDCSVEGDWSQAAFFMTAAALGGSVTIDNLDMDSAQGDKACVDIYRRFGADIRVSGTSVTINPGSLRGIELNAADIPDMVPALAVTAALSDGTTIITGAERLRIKECDRLAAMTEGLSRLGADIRETPDGLLIKGVKRLTGGLVEGYNDHRIVMSFAVAGAGCDGDIVITDRESIRKSYPDFFDDYARLGGLALAE